MSPRKPFIEHKTRIKTRWTPETPKAAQSLLDQIERAILNGNPSENPDSPPFTTFDIPAHAANYLLDAIRMIRGGLDANAALHLVANQRGRTRNNDRDDLIAIMVRERMSAHRESQETATAEVGAHFNLGQHGAENARKNGHQAADFFDQIRQFGGDGAADEYMDYLIRKSKRG